MKAFLLQKLSYDTDVRNAPGFKSFLPQGLFELEFHGDLVYKLNKIVGSNNFSAQFIKIISHYILNY